MNDLIQDAKRHYEILIKVGQMAQRNGFWESSDIAAIEDDIYMSTVIFLLYVMCADENISEEEVYLYNEFTGRNSTKQDLICSIGRIIYKYGSDFTTIPSFITSLAQMDLYYNISSSRLALHLLTQTR